MNKRIVAHLALGFLCTALPALCSYAAQSDIFFNELVKRGILGSGIPITIVQDYCLWIGIALTALLLGVQLVCTQIRRDQMTEQRNALIEMYKNVFTNSLSKELGKKYLDVDIRIFVPKKSFIYYIKHCFNKNTTLYFVIRNIETLASPGMTNGLAFEVYPKQQGLVGLSYTSKMMIYDDKLEETNATEYQMGQYQIDKTSDLKFSICIPILDKGDKVVAIMALDSKDTIKIDENHINEVRNSLLSFSRSMYDSIPELFKPIGGVV